MIQISVIVPVYNVEKYIIRCVDSILAQSFKNFEVILINDGSTDNCGIICDHYATTDIRVRVIHQNNKGQAAARNVGVRYSKGDYICFVDGDDIIHPQMLELLFDEMARANAEICCCGCIEERENSEIFISNNIGRSCCQEVVITDEGLYDLFHSKEYLYGVVWGKLVSRELVTAHLFTEGRIYEDSAVVCQWLYYAKRVVKVPEPLYCYFINSESTIRKPFSKKRLDILWSLEEQEGFFRRVCFPKMVSAVLSQYIVSATECYNQLYKLEDKKTANRVKKALITKWIKNKKQITIDSHTKQYIIACIFPEIMNLYWLLKRWIKWK